MYEGRRLQGLQDIVAGWIKERVTKTIVTAWRQMVKNNKKVTRGLEMMSVIHKRRLIQYLQALFDYYEGLPQLLL